ncbi:MAG: (Fe-S)-binding protein [Spirochaetes bacterium]|nr:(Fe-S)-binding protein [Spirochaetota bacterium]
MDKKRKYPYFIENPLEHDRVRRFLDIFSAILETSNYRYILDLYSRVTMKCSRCASECQIYQATNDPKDIPCHRTSILLKIYKRHFTLGGWLKAKFTGGSGLTEKDIDEMLESYWNCTGCGRCVLYCPLGIDHRIILRLGRYILSEMGIVPKNLLVSTREQLQGETHNSSKVPLKALQNTVEFLEEEIEEIKGVKVKYPIDVYDAEYIFFTPVSDYLVEPDTLMGIACVLHEANISWTIGGTNCDGVNYGLFYSDSILGDVNRSLISELRRLRAKKILIGECGHAYRAIKDFLPTYNDGEKIEVVSIMELTLQLIEEGKIQLDKNVIKEKITYHDPCNIVRQNRGIEEPRKIIRSFINDFVELKSHGQYGLCCGGGGGTVAVDETNPYRMNVAGKMKAEEIKASGADIIITPCANCKKQIGELIQFNKLPMRHAGLHDLIFEAIIMKDGKKHGTDD